MHILLDAVEDLRVAKLSARFLTRSKEHNTVDNALLSLIFFVLKTERHPRIRIEGSEEEIIVHRVPRC